mgnify:CR=1 FL=1
MKNQIKKKKSLKKPLVNGMCFSPDDKLTFEFLYERGYIPTCRVGAGNTIYNKWGFELDIHCNFVYCKARTKWFNCTQGYISTKGDLIDIEKRLEIDNSPLITKMSVEELKTLIPKEYTYTLNKRKKKIHSESNLSFNTKSGRYKITKGKTVISEGYNNEEESYFLCRSLLYIFEVEKLLPTNSIGLKHYR